MKSTFSLFLSTTAKYSLFDTSSYCLSTLFSCNTSSKSCIYYLNLKWVWSSCLCIAVMVFSYPSIRGLRVCKDNYSEMSASFWGHPTGSFSIYLIIWMSSSYSCYSFTLIFYFNSLISDSFSLSFEFNLLTRKRMP